MTPTLADDLTMGSMTSLLPYLGIPGTMLAVLVWAFAKGWVITGREAAKDQVQCREANTVLAARIAELKAEKVDIEKESRARLDDLCKEKDMWRDAALGNMRALESATDTAKKAAGKLVRQRPTNPEQD